ncbi:MAG: 6-phosphofructokinase [Prolixibacteraceae bacterium]|jgi:6-phosphofructokinase 1|nr:6-phosphofructokinase [Prolixibacteraceae bacterium]
MTMHKEFKRIAVFTSGGDAPGMNAAIRAVTRAGLANNFEIYGIKRGFQGMIEDDFFANMKANDVSGIMQQGGTFLQTARSEDFRTYEGREKAFRNLQKHEIDAVIVIGGDGSFTGALIFSQEFDVPFIGIPGTIDNDMYGTDYTIGYDTALNTVMQAVDKIKDTAQSHGRIFFIEVMGHEAGALALKAGVACGAEVTFIPEVQDEEKDLEIFLAEDYKTKKRSGIIMVAEGDRPGGALELANKVQKEYPEIGVRVSILGHMQRGGSPTVTDRVAATQMGVAAIDALLDDQKNIMVGLHNEKIVRVPLSKVVKLNRSFDDNLLYIQKLINSAY